MGLDHHCLICLLLHNISLRRLSISLRRLRLSISLGWRVSLRRLRLNISLGWRVALALRRCTIAWGKKCIGGGAALLELAS